jgi:hypothetical protein
MKKFLPIGWMDLLPSRHSPLIYFVLGIVAGVFSHYLLYRIFLPIKPFIYVAF